MDKKLFKTSKALNHQVTISILQEYFLKGKNKEFVTWTQISIFLAVYYTLLEGFSLCGHFIPELLEQSHLRSSMLQNLLDSSDQFTSLSVETVRRNQRLVTNNNDDTPFKFSDAIVRWDKVQPFTVVFSRTHDPLFVYKKVDDVPVSLRKEFQTYSELQRRNGFQGRNLLPDYNTLTHEQLFVKLTSLSQKFYKKRICQVCFTQYEISVEKCSNCPTAPHLTEPHKLKSEVFEKSIEKLANTMKNQYVITPDNYIKMLLIYLRVQSGLPVLIMGETGKCIS